MMLALPQIAVVLAVTVYLCRWRAEQRRRSAQSWDSILSRLRPGWDARELIDTSRAESKPRASTGERWKRVRGAQGLWAMYVNAGVMLEIADYAARNSESIGYEVLAALRCDAMQIRLLILKTVAGYVLSAMNERVSATLLQTESAYAELELQMTELLQLNAAEIVPSFVAAL